jgi:hypothetical protein
VLVFRLFAFCWFAITAWYWEVNLYALTNVTYTATWAYFLLGALQSVRGIVGAWQDVCVVCGGGGL